MLDARTSVTWESNVVLGCCPNTCPTLPKVPEPVEQITVSLSFKFISGSNDFSCLRASFKSTTDCRIHFWLITIDGPSSLYFGEIPLRKIQEQSPTEDTDHPSGTPSTMGVVSWPGKRRSTNHSLYSRCAASSNSLICFWLFSIRSS